MEMGLIGEAAVGRDPGYVLTGGEPVGGMVEANQLRGGFRWQPDLRTEPGP